MKIDDTNKDYEYAQYNNEINLINYTDDEYAHLIDDTNSDWTKQETDHLWELCRRFDLRFVVVHDRFGSDRTIEELKNRYYSVAKKVLEARQIFDHPILKSGYNCEQEIQRRACLDRLINKSVDEGKRADAFVKEAIVNYKKCEDFEKMKKDLDVILNQETFTNISLDQYLHKNLKQNESFVFSRSMKMYYPLPINEIILKRVNGFLKELNLPERLTATEKVESSYDSLKTKLILYSILKKHIEKRTIEKEKLEHRIQEIEATFQDKKVSGDYNANGEWTVTKRKMPKVVRSARKRVVS